MGNLSDAPHEALSAFVAIALAALTLAFPAHADDTHDTATSPKTASVTVKPGWHVNKEYPWKLVVGEPSPFTAKMVDLLVPPFPARGPPPIPLLREGPRRLLRRHRGPRRDR